MNHEVIISVLSLKSGVGVSTLVWNIAHTLDLDIYQHDRAMHDYFLQQRMDALENGEVIPTSVNVYNINKKKFKSGIYDIGSDINYPYIRQLLQKSNVVIVPIELGYEVILKSIATIKYIQEHNPNVKIIIVFNRLDNSDTVRERNNYTYQAEDFISEHIDTQEVEFLYLRHAFVIYRYLSKGFFFFDGYVKNHRLTNISNFRLLQSLRWYAIEKMAQSEVIKTVEKAEREKEQTDFFERFKPIYHSYFAIENESKAGDVFDLTYHDNSKKTVDDMRILTSKIKDGNVSDFISDEKSRKTMEDMLSLTKKTKVGDVFDLIFHNKNRKAIKDMLILTTKIKAEYSNTWEE